MDQPLNSAEFASLSALEVETLTREIPHDHQARLLALGFVEQTPNGGLKMTQAGRDRVGGGKWPRN